MRHSRERACERIGSGCQIVAPAKAEAQGKRLKSLDSRLRGNDEMSDAGFILTISFTHSKAGIQSRKALTVALDPRFRGGDGVTLCRHHLGSDTEGMAPSGAILRPRDFAAGR